MSDTEQEFNYDDVIHLSVEKEIKQSYIDYAMSVIVSRALPDARDGLKPVQRRILYAMYDIGMTSGSKHRKSATVVWEVIGKYHPHGDSSIYDAMVRLAQPFSLRYPMVDGQGNFGSIDGDPAAAMRYTEARMTKIAEEMLEDIRQNTVLRNDTYDQSRLEPATLPTKFPYQLCNGTMGIAVGMATNMPPHNLTEVLQASLAMIENPDITVDEIMDNYIKGPDFPTGGMIFDHDAIKEVYRKWRGSIVMRGKVHFETDSKKRDVIVIDEIPYQVNKSTLVEKIATLVEEKKLEGIEDITDESNKNIIRVTIVLRKGISKQDILTRLYKYTELQSNFSVNNVALIEAGKQPKHVNVKELLEEFVGFRRLVVTKRSIFQLDKAQARLHILLWLQRAVDILDAVIALIRGSSTREEAKTWLMEQYEFSAEQAEYILMLRLQTLVGLEIQKILDEIGEKNELIAFLQWLLADPKKLDAVIIDEMNYMIDEYGDERKTELSGDTGVYALNANMKRLKELDAMIKEPVITLIDNNYNVKVLYQTRVLNVPDDTHSLTYTHNQDRMIALSAKGELVVKRLKDLGSFTIKSKPLDVKKDFGLTSDLVFAETMEHDFDYFVMLTNRNNIKKVKKSLISSFKKFPTIVMNLDAGEHIIRVIPIKIGQKIWIISAQGRILLFNQNQVRDMGKTSWGVKAMELTDGDKAVDMCIYDDEPFIFLHDGKAGKMLSVEDLFIQKRWEMKRAQTGVQCAALIMGQELAGVTPIIEWSVNLLLDNGQITHLDSDTMELKLPEDPLTKVTNATIVKMYVPRQEKSKKWEKEEEWTDETSE
jgi:DNA gyrase subunit A